jgi:hypothetical protein
MKISHLIGSALIASSVAALSVVASPLTANAANFNNIIGGDTGGDSVVSQFSFSVTDNGAGKTLWKFKNAATPTSNSASVIAQIYFEWAKPVYALSVSQLNSGNVGTVNFSTSFNGPNALPQNNSINDLAIGATNPAPTKGVNLGETLGVIFNSASANDIETAINEGNLTVGIHVTGIAAYSGKSDSYITTPTTKPVPVPGLVLGVMAAGVFGGTRLLKNKKQVA